MGGGGYGKDHYLCDFFLMVDVTSMGSMEKDAGTAAAEINQLRSWRVRADRSSSLSDAVANLQRHWQKAARQTGDFAEAWEACVAAELKDQCRVDTMRGGVARVIVSSSAVAFQLDRTLRSGLLTELRARCSAAVTRVETRIGQVRPATRASSKR